MESNLGLNFIGGEFVPARSGGKLESGVADSDLLDLVAAIQSAHKALPNWMKAAGSERATLIAKLADLIEANGATIGLSSRSVERAIKIIRHHVARAENFISGSTTSEHSLTHHLPIGLVGIITPMADPLFMLASRVSAALITGNVVIAKPSEFAPREVQVFCEMVRDAGLPTGVFNVVQGRGAEIGRALVEHPGVATLAFAGSTDTGREVAKIAGESLKRLHLSLGARNPVLIFAGVDLDQTVSQLVDLAFGSEPMACWRGSRIFIQESIYKDFIAALKTHMASKAIPGPLAHSALTAKFNSAIRQAVKENGKILFGAEGTEAVPATAIFDLTMCSTLQQDEIIGPFATISSFKYQLDAVKFANTSPYGKVAYLFHPDQEKALSIARKIESGMVVVNASQVPYDPRVAVGGLKLSGDSREGGDEWLRFFTREATVFTALPITVSN